MAKTAGRLKLTKCAGRRYSHEVAWYEGGKRQRKFFTDKTEAKLFFDDRKKELHYAAPADAPMTAEEREALRRARTLQIPLLAAVESYAIQREKDQRSLQMDVLVERRRQEAARINLSERYEKDLERILDDIAAAFGSRSAASLTAEDATAWVYRKTTGGSYAAGTIKRRKALLSGVFSHGVKIGALEKNVAAHVSVPQDDSAESIGILSPAEARTYLEAVVRVSPALLPMEAIRLFAGLRHAESERLDWSAVQLERGFIEIRKGIAKTRSRRLVDIEPALAHILRQITIPPPVYEGGTLQPRPVRPINSRDHRDRAMKAAGWRGETSGKGTAAEGAPPWPENALRHSYVSYHLAAGQNLARTALQAGHNEQILLRHYRELVTVADAKIFWDIRIEAPHWKEAVDREAESALLRRCHKGLRIRPRTIVTA